MRPLAPLASLAAFVVLTGTASGTAAGALSPVQTIVGLTHSRVRHIPLVTPTDSSGGAGERVRVIVTLDPPPLAAAAHGDAFATRGPRRKLDVASSASQAYLARIDAAQQAAVAALHRAVPDATVGRRFQVLLDGLTVSVPYSELPEVLDLRFARRVYPSLRYTLDLNRSTSIIGAPQFTAATGDGGQGVKIAIVDDGVDTTHPFLDPTGFSYPPGFPKGIPDATTPKVIAVRSYPSPGVSGAPIDRGTSFHGTFVAGVAAGDANTDAPASTPETCAGSISTCHPEVKGLSGVAPRAWIGSYRVFNVTGPNGGCCSANTPEIIAAFEAAVKDGMDVINFSGGSPQSDPASDALIEATDNVAKAGVVPVISAGNDRDFFGLGTVGSPSTAPDAISVAATDNSHIFGRALTVVSPSVPALQSIAFVPGSGGVPASWSTAPQKLVDVGSIKAGGQPVDRLLCGSSPALPSGSLQGAIALVTRGGCTYDDKAARATQAGAIGTIVADNRPGDPQFTIFGYSGGAISDLDGARLREAMAANGGVATIRIGQDQVEIPTSWGGVPTSFSSAGLTAFGHQLKPDLAAPGAQIISSTLPEYQGDPYVVLDGTSFSAPHVSGAAALLLARHPTWTPAQVKSALMSTAGPAGGDTALTQEASVYLEGAGIPRLSVADRPLIFTDPQSLSFGYLNVSSGSASKAITVAISDAGGGAGTWSVELQPQSTSSGAAVEAAPVTLGPGGTAMVQIVARAPAHAPTGDDYGFVLLRRGTDVRRIPYAFVVSNPGLAAAQVIRLKASQKGDTRSGVDRARVYRWPTAPFNVLSLFGLDTTSVSDDGKETVYELDISKKAVNAGVVVVSPAPKLDASVESMLDSNAPIQPWFLGSQDENDVLGYAGVPVNVNSGMPDYLFNVGAAGANFLAPGRYFIAVDSGHDPFSGRSLAGRYVLRSWVNDVTPPNVKLVTTTVSSGRPTIVARVTDAKSGVDPLSLQLEYRTTQLGAASFDPASGIAVFTIPRQTTELQPDQVFMKIVASDYEETKNVNTPGTNPLPNTRIKGIQMHVVDGPAATWITPGKGACLARVTKLLAVANDNRPISSVGFFVGGRQIARVRKNVDGLYAKTWRTGGLRKGPHVLRVVVSDTAGRESETKQVVRVCG